MNLNFYILLSLLICVNSFTQPMNPLHTNEIIFANSSGSTVYVRIYPISMVFNHSYNYDMISEARNDNFTFINGVTVDDKYITLPNNIENEGWGHEHEGNAGEFGNIGYGDYKIEFSTNNSFTEIFDSLIVQYDFMFHIDIEGEEIHDLNIYISYPESEENENFDFKYKWEGNCPETSFPVNRRIQHWNRCNITGEFRTKQMGPFYYETANNNEFNILPQDYQIDCGGENIMENIFNNRYGLLTLDLIVTKTPIYSRYEPNISNPPSRVILSQGTNFTLYNDVHYEVKYNGNYVSNNNYYQILNVQPTANLRLNSNAVMTFEKTNKLVLEKNSNLIVNSGATISMERYSHWCNYGANITNNGTITIRGISCHDPTPSSPVSITGIGIFELDSVNYYIPDSTTYTFDSNAVFVCKPYTTINFGKNSKLVFQNGARISANGCKFVSIDSTQTWDGIYLSDDANDTIKNCVIQNAYNGINIAPPSTVLFVNYTAEITNCTFKNTTNTKLLNQVYINGADGILIKECNTVSAIDTGYASCIVMQYCPSGGVVVTDNSFTKCDIGISAIQSSPYIARNVITGSSNWGTGIHLDNSNGTIEYNIITNFLNSISGSYSSPYLLKNTLSDASVHSIGLTSYSVPVLKPIASGELLRWLGGNNTITGSPTNGAFNFDKNCNPMLDSGYNVIHVGNDYAQGVLDAEDFYATLNYWYDNPPNSALFNISGGTVYYEPTFDGTTLPSTDYFELNALGFGMYDSVFVKDNGDNPTAGSLYMQAYTSEMQENYTTAITKYKEVVSDYKTSSYAPVALARIFNCLEKNNSNSSDYSTIQSYYAGTKNDTNNLTESREISEDFEIKSKVRQGNLMEAVTNYDNIYTENMNNSKGQHALLNKLCLMQMISGEGDNHGSVNNKANIIALISGKSVTKNATITNNTSPKIFRLYQNYPNPFNPVTMIKYEIPNESNVLIKIYDILGKEVFSINEYKKAGNYEVRFDGTNLASGLYFYSFETNGYRDTKKMVLIK